MRSVPEWMGTDDTAIPSRVKVRVFERAKGRCQLCDRPIGGSIKAAYDHVVPLIAGGENREGNLQLLCVSPCHAEKTKTDIADKSRAYQKRKKAIGIKKPSSFRGWRRLDGTVVFNKKRGSPG